MEYALWAPRYEAIRSAFGYPMERERASKEALLERLPAPMRRDPLGRIARRLHGREVVIAGLAPDWGPPPMWRWSGSGPAPTLVAADGATEGCLAAGLVPALIATDLDGPVPAEVEANARGALVVIHAHGDNRAAVERWTGEFPGELVGSWAGPPEEGVIDVGGFTDGDRAAFLAEHVGAARIVLWGFDFDRVAEAERGGPKRAKLAWAKRLFDLLALAGRVPIERWERDGSWRPYVPTGPSIQ
jgi:2-amino-4-hydroxy-6-hydroxymethyldihydropteridine diphosphokinase